VPTIGKRRAKLSLENIPLYRGAWLSQGTKLPFSFQIISFSCSRRKSPLNQEDFFEEKRLLSYAYVKKIISVLYLSFKVRRRACVYCLFAAK